MHTPLCKHAKGLPEDYARQGIRQGLQGIIITCHSPMPDGFSPEVRMADDQFTEYLAMVSSAQEKMEGKIEVRLGLESDWYPGMEPWLTELHQRADFDYILGSVHPFTREYGSVYDEGPDVLFSWYFKHLAESAESGLFDCLSHPDLIKNSYPEEWFWSRVRDQVEPALDRIAATGVCMELNTSGAYKALPEMNPTPPMLKAMCERGIPVVLGSDSHLPERVADRFPEALHLLKNVGYPHVNFFNQRQRQTLDIDQALLC